MRTILNWYQDGGSFILPLLFEGVARLLLLAERTMFMVAQSKIHVRPFIEKVISLVHADKLDEALKLCAEHQSALPDLGLVLLRSKSRDESDLIHVAETATLTVVPSLSRRLAWLPALAVIAVLLGVVGGVANMHEALVRSADPLRIGVAYALRPFGVGVLTAI